MDQIVLGRIGHYFDAGNGSCSTAIAVEAFEASPTGQAINVVAWHHGGEQFSRTSVPVVDVVAGEAYHENSFHLNRDCPWSR